MGSGASRRFNKYFAGVARALGGPSEAAAGSQPVNESRPNIARIAAFGAVLVAILLAAYLLFLGGGAYSVRLQAINAQQLVNGNLVELAGVKVGTVTDRRISDDGQAEITIEIDEDHAPLRRGTTAIIRQGSLS